MTRTPVRYGTRWTTVRRQSRTPARQLRSAPRWAVGSEVRTFSTQSTTPDLSIRKVPGLVDLRAINHPAPPLRHQLSIVPAILTGRVTGVLAPTQQVQGKLNLSICEDWQLNKSVIATICYCAYQSMTRPRIKGTI